MTANQYMRLYDFFKQNFNVDEAKARVFAEEIENIVEEKFESEKANFAPINALDKLDFKIELLRQEMKTGFAELKAISKKEFFDQRLWLVPVMFTIATFIIIIVKVLH